MNWKENAAALAALLALAGIPAHANVMTFGTGTAQPLITTSLTENRITATPATSSGADTPHFDILATRFGRPEDNVAEIHRGNAGEKIAFTFAGGAFDAISILIEAMDYQEGVTDLTGTLTSSAGGIITFTAAGEIDFSGPLWSNITWFTMEVPVGDYRCVGNADCSGIAFDDVVMTAPDSDPDPVPEPASLGLFGLGLAALRWVRRRS